jgi:diacylglycerol kinase (ATP)
VRQIGRKLERFEATIDGTTHRASFVLVSRTRNYGGDVAIARGASILSNAFEVILFDAASVLELVWFFGGIVTRTLGIMRGVTVRRATRVSLQPCGETVHVQVDGEYAGVLPAEVELVPDSIRLLVPNAWLAAERARLG